MGQSTKNHDPNEMNRLGKRVAGTAKRDVVIGNVGGNARGVVIGKNIVQIGELIVPMWAVYLVCLVMLGILAVVLYFLVYPRVMSVLIPERMPEGSFNIAVAEFTVSDSTSSREDREAARQLSKSFAGYITLQQHPLSEVVASPVVVWGFDQAIKSLGREEPPERRIESLNADVLLYGTVEKDDDNGWYVSPAFYLTDSVVQLADELIGEHTLGTPIPVEFANPASLGRVNQEIRARTKALMLILMGLWDYSTGTSANYLNAAQRFEEAASDPEWGAATQKKGQEVLYLFVGNAYLKLASLTDEPGLYKQYIDASESAFNRAIAYNPNYARSYNGLGSLYFLNAQLSLVGHDECAWNWDELARARENYETARALPDPHKPESGRVDLRANVGLGRIYYFLGYCLSTDISPEEWQTARHYHEQVLEEYQNAPAPYLELAASLASQDLADMAFYEATWRLALDETDSTAPGLTAQAILHYQQSLDFLEPINTEEELRLAENVVPHLVYAMCLVGQREEAIATLEQFVTDHSIPDVAYSAMLQFSQEVCVHE